MQSRCSSDSEVVGGDTDVGSGEGWVGLVWGVLSEVVEELAQHSPAEEESWAGVEESRHQGEGRILERYIFSKVLIVNLTGTYEGGGPYQFEGRPGEVVAEQEDEGGQETGGVHQA